MNLARGKDGLVVFDIGVVANHLPDLARDGINHQAIGLAFQVKAYRWVTPAGFGDTSLLPTGLLGLLYDGPGFLVQGLVTEIDKANWG